MKRSERASKAARRLWGVRWVRVACAAALMTNLAAQAGEFDCLIEPRRVVHLASPVQAPIVELRVDRGDVVKRGDVLVRFEVEVERAAAELAKFRSEMTGTIEARQARFEYLKEKLARREDLSKRNFVSKQDVDDTEAEKRLAEAELKEALDSRRLAELEYRRALAVTKLRTLESPVSGVVLERMMHEGEVADIGAKPILKLAEIDTLFVEVILPLSAYGHVDKGMQLKVRPEKPIGGQHAAKVVVVDRVFDASSGTFGIRLELPNAKGHIPAGVRCKVDLPGVETRRGAIEVKPR